MLQIFATLALASLNITSLYVGGGALDLVPYSKNGKSKAAEVNEFFYKHINPDTSYEMFFVGNLTPM